MNLGITELDLHGCDLEEAKGRIDKAVAAAGRSVYRIRIIHGYHGGTGIKSMIRDEYGYGREAKVLRIEDGTNQGISELVLREL